MNELELRHIENHCVKGLSPRDNYCLELAAEVRRLRGVLRFYAEKGNWQSGKSGRLDGQPCIIDMGKLARTTLTG